jgi:hypothetical protein
VETGQSGYADSGQFEHALRQVEQRLNRKLEKIMAAQDDINAAGQAIIGLLTDMQADIAEIGNGVTAIQAALAAMPAAVDTTALDAAVAQIAQAQASLDASAASVANVVPPAPAP